MVLLVASVAAWGQTTDLIDNENGTWTLPCMPPYDVELQVEYEDDDTPVVPIDLVDNENGTWTLTCMPPYDVELQVEYEDDDTPIVPIDLTDNGDGTWTLPCMPAYDVTLQVEYEDAPLAYAEYTEETKTLTFYYDYDKESRNGMDIGPFKNDYDRGWDAQRKNITTVVFDKSFADCKEVTSTAHWFRDFSSLSTIVGIENLITKNVTTMIGMFRGCSSLESIDVSHFNTANVTTMRFLFFGCSSLKRLDVRAFNTAQVTDMNGMFRGCSSLTVLDLCNLNTTQVTDMGYMFYGSSDLTTIYGNDAWTCSSSDKMFTDCTSLKGAIAYDAAKTDVSMANPTTGYFTKELPVLKGDANHDGKVDETDIQPIVDYIMTGKTDGFYFDNANLNGDTKVDAADLVLLINQVNNP